MRQINIFALLIAICISSGCSKTDEEISNQNPDAEPFTGIAAEAAEKAKAESDAAAKKAANAAKLATFSKTPASEYEILETGEQAAYLYYAIANIPTDHDAIAQKLSSKYRFSMDGFEKKEILNSLKPAIDENINAYKEKPIGYIRASAELGPYDFDRKGFVIGAVGTESTYYSFDNYKVQFKNSGQVNFIEVNDETIARELESMRAGYNNKPIAKIYFIADNVNLDGKTIKSLITNVEIVEKSGRVLASIQPSIN